MEALSPVDLCDIRPAHRGGVVAQSWSTMTLSRIIASGLTVYLLGTFFASAPVYVVLSSTMTGMTVVGWLLVWFGVDIADVLSLPDSWNPTVLRVTDRFIKGLGWLSLLVVAGLHLLSKLS